MIYTEEQVLEAMKDVVAEVGAEYVYPKEESIHVLTREEFEAREHADLFRQWFGKYDEYLACGTCSYVNRDGKPSCIVGRVVEKLDPTAFEELAKYERNEGEFPVSYMPPRIIQFNGPAKNALSVAQLRQDRGQTFGDALGGAHGELWK